MSHHFRLGQYTRHDYRVWSSPCGVRITDPATIATLEAEYRAAVRQSHGQRPPRGRHTPQIQATRNQYQTPREKRASGRAE